MNFTVGTLSLFLGPAAEGAWRTVEHRWHPAGAPFPTHMIFGAQRGPGAELLDQNELRAALVEHLRLRGYPTEPVAGLGVWNFDPDQQRFSSCAPNEAVWWVRSLNGQGGGSGTAAKAPALAEPGAPRSPLPDGWTMTLRPGAAPGCMVRRYIHPSGLRVTQYDQEGGRVPRLLSVLAEGPHGPTMRCDASVLLVPRARLLVVRPPTTSSRGTGMQTEVAQVTLQATIIGDLQPIVSGSLADGSECSLYRLPPDPLLDVPLVRPAQTFGVSQ